MQIVAVPLHYLLAACSLLALLPPAALTPLLEYL